MSLKSTRRAVLIKVGVLAIALGSVVAGASATAADRPAKSLTAAAAIVPSTDWPTYERNSSHSSAVFADTAVTTANAGALTRKWTFTAGAATMRNQPARGFDSSPTLVGNRVYILSRTAIFYALDSSTGAIVWRKQLDFGNRVNCAGIGTVGTATVTPDPVSGTLTVYVPGSHFLYALNAATGAQRWRTPIGPNTTAGNSTYFNWSSPTVAGGRIFMGLSAKCDSNPIRGGVVSINQRTGARQHTWYDVPANKVGGSVWSSVASDGTNVWVGTGNPDPTGTTIDDTYSVVRLAASTLTKQDKYTVDSPQNADLDFGSSPTLFDATYAGAPAVFVGACNKNGVFYAWRANNLAAGPVWSRTVGAVGGMGTGACITSAAWDYKLRQLFVASNATTIAGTSAPGGLRALNVDTGALIWEKALPCLPNGSPTLNGQIIAVPMYTCPAGVSPSVLLFRESDGQQIADIPATGKVFAQPVLAGGLLLIASEDGVLNAYQP